MSRSRIVASFAALGLLASSQAANAGVFAEVNGQEYGFYFVPPGAPVGSLELGAPSGFGGKWDKAGRTLSGAAITEKRNTQTSPLTQIQSGLWSDGDVDTFKFKITDPSSFNAYVNSTTAVLTLFAADGTALGGSRGGGTANALSQTSLGISLPAGEYYISVGVGATLPVARNSASQNLFDFSTNGVKLPVTGLADYKLATDPYVAFATAGVSPYILPGTGSFTAGSGGYINLSGADFVLPIPEPTALAFAAGAGVLALRRRK
jgi:hypothetical protein